MAQHYILKRDDGAYLWYHNKGNAYVTSDIYKSPMYEERGAKTARGWLNDKERWSLVVVNVTVEEAE